MVGRGEAVLRACVCQAGVHLVEAGVCGILNFAGARIHVPEKVVVEYVDFFHYLYALGSITGSEHRSK